MALMLVAFVGAIAAEKPQSVEDLARFLERTKREPPPQRYLFDCCSLWFYERGDKDVDQDGANLWDYALIENLDGIQFFDEGPRIAIRYQRTAINKGPGPDLILMSWSGGAHCCLTFHVFQLRENYITKQQIDAWDSEGEIIVKPGRGATGFTFDDSNFAYWNTPFASSPMPNVVLKWSGDRYVADRAAMLKPPPTEAEFAAMRKEVAAALSGWKGPYVPLDDDWDVEEHGQPRGGVEVPAPPPILWDHLLKLIYTGHARLAVRLFDESWPQGVEGKAAFWRDFTRRLRRSPTWREFGLERLLGARPVFAYTPR
ncbi:MAG: hypothetical protein HY246_01180 [Proteobacteria bacterium]|nr:hypothetical protein [Pseudomonadota bacterium]